MQVHLGILIGLRIISCALYAFCGAFARGRRQTGIGYYGKRRGDDAKRLELYLPITSRSARLPEPFDPRIAKTSPPWTRADTSLSTAVGSDLFMQLPSITTAVEWSTFDMSRMQSDGIILRNSIMSGSHDHIPQGAVSTKL